MGKIREFIDSHKAEYIEVYRAWDRKRTQSNWKKVLKFYPAIQEAVNFDTQNFNTQVWNRPDAQDIWNMVFQPLSRPKTLGNCGPCARTNMLQVRAKVDQQLELVEKRKRAKPKEDSTQFAVIGGKVYPAKVISQKGKESTIYNMTTEEEVTVSTSTIFANGEEAQRAANAPVKDGIDPYSFESVGETVGGLHTGQMVTGQGHQWTIVGFPTKYRAVLQRDSIREIVSIKKLKKDFTL